MLMNELWEPRFAEKGSELHAARPAVTVLTNRKGTIARLDHTRVTTAMAHS
jgi:hypothetical protein